MNRRITGIVLVMAMLALSVNIGYAENTAVNTSIAVNAVLSGSAAELPAEGGTVIFDKTTGTVTGFTGSVKSVNIPSTAGGINIKAIGREAFKNCLSLESITIAGSVTDIGEFSFDHCTKLKSVVMPKGITAIRKGVFNWCTALDSVTISPAVTAIDAEAFSNCSKVKLVLKTVKGSVAEKFALDNGYRVSYVTEEVWNQTTTAVTTQSTTEAVTQSRETTSETTTGYPASRGGKRRKIKVYIPSTTEESTEETTGEDYESGEEEEPVEDIISGDVKVTIGSSIITVGDIEYMTDAAPYIQPDSGSTLVPLRFAAVAVAGGDLEEALDSDIISWNAVTKTATIRAGGRIVSFTAGSADMLVDSAPVTMDNGVKAEITGGRMFIPFRALGDALGVNVYWDAENKTALYSVK